MRRLEKPQADELPVAEPDPTPETADFLSDTHPALVSSLNFGTCEGATVEVADC